MRVAVLHPGDMGASVVQALVAGGHEAGWLSEGRSEVTRQRALDCQEFTTLQSLVQWAQVVISVCPPHAAIEVAQSVAAANFAGLYVDANAVAPDSAHYIHRLFGEQYVDGGIVGPPAYRADSTRLHLSGKRAPVVAELFAGSLLDTRVVGEGVSAASALKMAYAAYTKGLSALLLDVHALADAADVRQALEDEWDQSQPGLADRSRKTAKAVAPKAWRFVGEMEEIAATFQQFDLPHGFHLAARDVYQRLASAQGANGGLEDALRALQSEPASTQSPFSTSDLFALKAMLESQLAADFVGALTAQSDASFDFLIGEWEVERTSFGADGAIASSSRGHVVAQYVFEGRAIQEDFYNYDAQGVAFRGGTALYTLSPSTQEWHVAAIDASTGATSYKPVWVDGEVRYESVVNLPERDILTRSRIFNISPHGSEWEQQVSIDGDQWFPNYHISNHRKS